MTKPDPEPLGALWYLDGTKLLRCKVCQQAQADGHRETCVIWQTLTLVADIIESDAMMGSQDIDRLVSIQDLLAP